jgi:hypothetical protein
MALINDGWIITDDPFRLEIGKTQQPLEVDLAAEKLLVAEKGNQKILVEIKTFARKSMIHQFHEVLGQYLNYEGAILINEIDRILYLAVSEEVYLKMSEISFIMQQLKRHNVKVVVVDIQNQKIIQWQI